MNQEIDGQNTMGVRRRIDDRPGTKAVRRGQNARQGDVILLAEDADEQDWAPVGPDGCAVAEGRASHVIRGDAMVAQRQDGATAIRVGPGGAALIHEHQGGPGEHATLSLEPGWCGVAMRQRVWDANQSRTALD